MEAVGLSEAGFVEPDSRLAFLEIAMLRMLILSFSCLAVQLVPFTIGKAHCQEPNVIDRVIADWAERQQRCHSLLCALEGTKTTVRGVFNGDTDLPASAKGDIPAADFSGELKIRWQIDFANNKVRKETKEHRFFSHLLQFAPTYQIALFDGKEIKVFAPRDKNTSDIYTPGKYQPDLWIQTPKHTVFVISAVDLPIFWHCGCLATGTVAPRPQKLRVQLNAEEFELIKTVTYQGRRHAVLKTNGGKHDMPHEYWVDLERKGAISLAVAYIGSSVFKRTKVIHRETPLGWLPDSWTSETFSFDVPGKLTSTESVQVKEFVVNGELLASTFELRPESGMIVRDVMQQKNYEVNQSGGLEEFPREGKDGPVGWSSMWIWLLIPLIVFLAFLTCKKYVFALGRQIARLTGKQGVS